MVDAAGGMPPEMPPPMPPDLTLRPATPADVPDVLRLVRGLAEYERMPDEVTATEDDIHDVLFGPVPRAHAVLAEAAGRPIGLALYYYTLNTFKAARNIFLEDLFVEPAYRGSGIGLALMRHLARLAVAEGCHRIEWRVLNWNQPAIDFYQQIGARPSQSWHAQQLMGRALAALAQGTSHG
jgi:GNAT superfamily N-acetyltransferase